MQIIDLTIMLLIAGTRRPERRGIVGQRDFQRLRRTSLRLRAGNAAPESL
jgi:hypothetical protein